MGKDIRKLEMRVKALEEMLGLQGTEGSKNIHLMVTTIRTQGNSIDEMNNQIMFQNAALELRNEFINKSPERKGQFEEYLREKEKQYLPPPPENTPALEIKDDFVRHAPHGISPQWTMCNGLAKDSRMVQHGESVSCEKCIKMLENAEAKRRAAAPVTEHIPPGPIPDPKPKGCDPDTCGNQKPPRDPGGKIERK